MAIIINPPFCHVNLQVSWPVDSAPAGCRSQTLAPSKTLVIIILLVTETDLRIE